MGYSGGQRKKWFLLPGWARKSRKKPPWTEQIGRRVEEHVQRQQRHSISYGGQKIAN